MDVEKLLFDISTFIAGLFMLERGADIFIDHSAALSKKLGLPESLIALLTAGAEWEELAVVILSLVQRQPGLALGNVIGSNIANILGAFSLGLLAQSQGTTFDRSSKLYAITLFVVTSAVSVLARTQTLGKSVGGMLIAVFVVYIISVAASIYRGVLTAPEDSDSDSDSDTDTAPENYPELFEDASTERQRVEERPIDASTPLLSQRANPRKITSHVLKILLGFGALTVSGFILSHSSSDIARAAGISDTSFGATILAFATTLPEKFVAVISGTRGHSGILVANTIGSNIFLLTLCLGIILLSTDSDLARLISLHEIYWMWTASAFLLVVVLAEVWTRTFGLVMFAGYLTFLVLDLTIFHLE